MKKFLLFLMFAMFCIPWVTNAQTTVEIGDGTAGSNRVPINTYYNYSISEQLYTADEIGTAGNITSISFNYINTVAKDFPIEVYMKSVDAADLSEAGVSLDDAELVFSGTLSVTDAGWYTIDLDAPFAYDGTSNLLIGVNKGYVYWFSGNSWQCTATDVTMARYSENDNNAYTTSTTPSTASASRPNIQLTIVAGGGPVCERPDNFEVSNITGYGADFAWTGTVGNYTFEYKKASETDWTVVTGLTATNYTLSNLESMTAYNARVKAVCGTDLESGYKTASFTTLEVCPDGYVCIGEGTATSNYVPAHNFYNYSLTQQIYTADEIGEAGAILSIDFFKASTNAMEKNLDIYMVSTPKDEFDSLADFIPVTAGNLVFSGTVTFADNAWTTIELDAPFVFDGTSNVAIMVDNNTGGYVSSTPFYVFTSDKNQALYAQADGTNHDPFAPAFSYRMTQKNRIRLHIGEPPACPKPTGVTVNYEGGTEATISWTSDATAWNIDVNGTVTAITENPYTLTGLELSTDYEVKVQADCGDAESEWTNAVSFTTDACMPENMCELTYELSDSYGDGWNGNYINVVDVETEAILATWTMSSGGSASGTLAVCDGRAIQFQYVVSGTNSYPGENSWVIKDINEEVIWEYESPSASMSQDHTVSCVVTTCRKPTNLAASEIGSRTATLSWTENGEATAWNLMVDGVLIENVTNPYTLTGLTPETAYTVQVSPVCEVEKWSDAITFRTDVACPAPTALEVVPTPFSATVTWTGDASNYTLRYGTCAEPDPTQPATIIFHADDIWQDGSGYQMLLDADATAYGTIIPETGPLTESGDASAEVYAEFEYKIPANADGECSTSNVVIDNTITLQIPAGTYDWCITNPTPGDRIWIASAQGNVGGRADDYVFEGGKTYEFNMYMLGSNDATDVTVRCSNVDWTMVNNATTPYTINGLDPETEYYVGVQTVCGGEDGESVWTNTSFTTPSNCEAPNTLAAEVNGTTATLSWNGYQDNYTLRYRRTPYIVDTLFSEGFEDGIPATWTIINNDTTTIGDWLAVSDIPTTYSYYAGYDLSGWAHSGSNAAASASYVNGVGAIATDQYLITPQLTLNSTLRFFATSEYSDLDEYEVLLSTTGTSISDFNVTLQAMGGASNNSWDEVLIDLSDYAGQQGYIAIHHVAADKYFLIIDDFGVYDMASEDWTTVSTSENTYTVAGLDPEAEYEWYVEGINENCAGDLTSETANFTTGEQAPQTIALSAGTNWVSFNVETNLDALKAALVATGNTAITIQGQSLNATYNPNNGRWTGQLRVLDLSQMYKIKVADACEITLEGTPVDPSMYPVTIAPGVNYIAYPFNTNMTVTDAFAGFGVNGDVVQSQLQNANFNGSRWIGQLRNLEPGKGYIYKSASTETRVFNYPTSR